MNLKQAAAKKALEFVKSGMVMGLGTGSTTKYFVEMLGEKFQRGEIRELQAVPTSKATETLARGYGIPITTLAQRPLLDLAVDGADEIDPHFNLIKGLGRALLREKIVEIRAKQLIIISDESKLVPKLGTKGPLPIEIVPFEAVATVNWLKSQCSRAEWWHESDGRPIVTDNGNYLVRCWFEDGIDAPHKLSQTLLNWPGIVEHGMFLDMADRVIVAGEEGVNEVVRLEK